MKTSTKIITLLFLLIPLSLIAQDNGKELVGTWEINVVIDDGSEGGVFEFDIKFEEEKLTGKYRGRFGEADLNITYEDDHNFEIKYDTYEVPNIVFQGKLINEKMKGTCVYADGVTGTFTGKIKPQE